MKYYCNLGPNLIKSGSSKTTPLKDPAQEIVKQENAQADREGRGMKPQVLEFNFADPTPPAQDKEVNNFDDIPIQSSYNKEQNNMQQELEKAPPVNNHEDMVLPAVQKNINQEIPVNPHDEKPVGGGNTYGVDDIPIKSKANNFQELLQKELEENPDAARQNVSPPVKPKKKEFLKRSKPGAPPQKSKGTKKYKYYSENFADNSFEPVSKPPEKKKSKTPFGNVAERKAAQVVEEQKKPVQAKPKKNFLMRGGGIGGGIGNKNTENSVKNQKETPTKSIAEPKIPSSKPKSKPKRGQRKLFDDSDEENEESQDSASEKFDDDPQNEYVLKNNFQERKDSPREIQEDQFEENNNSQGSIEEEGLSSSQPIEFNHEIDKGKKD